MKTRLAIIVAAGKGKRFGGHTPKQFLMLGDRPVLAYSLEAFRQFDPKINIILVLPEENITLWENLRKEHIPNLPHSVIAGGITRFQSVSRGLMAAGDESLVAIHDGVRPLIKPETIAMLFDAAAKHTSAVPYSIPTETVRIERKKTSVIIDRSSVRLIQTPQVFDAALLKQAYQQKEDPLFTDDATVFEKAGGIIHLLECPADNIKITREEDLQIALSLVPGYRH